MSVSLERDQTGLNGNKTTLVVSNSLPTLPTSGLLTKKATPKARQQNKSLITTEKAKKAK